MAIKRTRAYAKKRKSMRNRRRYTTTKLSSIRKLMPRSQTLNVKRTRYWGTWAFDSTTTNGFWRYWEPTMATDFNNFSEFQAIFESYRVNGFRLKFVPRFNSLSGPVTGATPMTVVQPQITYVIDPSSYVTPSGTYGATTLNGLLENGAITRKANNPVSIYFKPKIAFATSGSGSVTFRSNQWLRTFEATQGFRGVHIYLHNNAMNTVNQDIVYDVFVTSYVSFKNLK